MHARCCHTPQLKKSGSSTDLVDMGNQLQQQGRSPADVRILLAEDNVINMKVALGILHRIGYSGVVTVENGKQVGGLAGLLPSEARQATRRLAGSAIGTWR